MFHYQEKKNESKKNYVNAQDRCHHTYITYKGGGGRGEYSSIIL